MNGATALPVTRIVCQQREISSSAAQIASTHTQSHTINAHCSKLQNTRANTRNTIKTRKLQSAVCLVYGSRQSLRPGSRGGRRAAAAALAPLSLGARFRGQTDELFHNKTRRTIRVHQHLLTKSVTKRAHRGRLAGSVGRRTLVCVLTSARAICKPRKSVRESDSLSLISPRSLRDQCAANGQNSGSVMQVASHSIFQAMCAVRRLASL